MLAKKMLAIPFLLAVLAAGNCFAQRGPGDISRYPVTSLGVGSGPCSEFLKVSKDPTGKDEDGYLDWAEAVMTGMNVANVKASQAGRDLNSSSPDDQKNYLSRYCASHPNHTFVLGVIDLYESLDKVPPYPR